MVWPFSRSEAPRSADNHRARLGRRGEKLARRFLRRRGMKVLASNYRCPAGEIDLIMLDRSTRPDRGADTIAFVEVKTRTTGQRAAPEAAVNAGKRRHMRKIAAYYLARHDQADELNIRFDVVAVTLNGDRRPEIRYLPGAF